MRVTGVGRRLAIGGLALFVSSCQQPQKPLTPNPTQARLPGAGLLETDRDTMVRAYRLAPDKRFLIAFSVAHAVAAGEPRAEVTTDFAGGAWHLARGGTEIGTLPEIPSFTDAFALLTRWSTTLLKAHPVAAAAANEPADPLDVDDSLSQLEAAQRSWTQGPHSTVVLQRAAHALVSLELQTFDDLAMADEIDGRAVALVALAKAAGGDTSPYEALLAKNLGYTAAGVSLAANLPPGVTRAFVLHDDASLEKLAQQPGASEATRELFLRRLDIRDEHGREERWIHDHLADAAYSMPVLFIRLFAPDFGPERAISLSLPDFAFLATLRRAGDPRTQAVTRDLQGWSNINAFARGAEKILADLNVQESTMLDAFEAAITKLAAGLTGPIFDAQTEQTYFRAQMYSALSKGAVHTVQRWNSKPAAESFLARWGSSGGAPATDFRLYVNELMDAQWHRASPSETLSTMKDLPSFGAEPARRLYNQLIENAEWGDPRVPNAARAMAKRLDTRLPNRRTLFHIAHEGVYDLPLAERLARSLLIESPPVTTYAETTGAWLLRDAAWYKARLVDPETPPSDAVGLLVAEETLGLADDATVRTEIRKRLALVPTQWAGRATYTDYLFEKEAFVEARGVAQDWLAHNPHVPGLQPVFATNVIANSFRRQGRPAEAWKTIEPVLSSQQGAALTAGAFALDALGRADEAEKLEEQNLDRYPYLTQVSDLAELYWRHGKNSEAAKLFAPMRVPISAGEMKFTIGAAFVRAFDKRPSAEALAAFEAMHATEIIHLIDLLSAVGAAGKHQLAFDMGRNLSAPGMELLEILVPRYANLAATTNHVQAVAWLKANTPPPLLEPLSQFAFGDGYDDLLWELVPTPDPSRKDDGADDIWMFRAAAVVRGTSEPHRAEVLAHYAQAPGGRYDIMGRYLIGSVDESRMLSLGDTIRNACEVAYWIGYRAQVEHRYADATQWYRLANESGQIQTFEYRQAHSALYTWYSGGKALSLL